MINALNNSKDWEQDIQKGHIIPVEGKIEKLEKGKKAVFSDGTTSLPIDLLVYATGYKYSFPFLDKKD